LIRRPKGRGNVHVARGIKKATLHRGWERVVVCASGPSFSQEQAALLARRASVQRSDPLAPLPRGWRVVVTNTSYQKVPTADVLYGGDRSWWEVYWSKVQATFLGECWTVNRWIAHNYGICHIEHSDEPGLSPVFGRIHSGGNSGYAAIGLAYLFGAREILLVGFDYQDSYGLSHWHGDHPPQLNQDRPHEGWLAKIPALIDGLRAAGVRVVNCSIETAIPDDVIPRGDLATCLS